MITVHATVGDQFLNTYWADGVDRGHPHRLHGLRPKLRRPRFFTGAATLWSSTPIAPHNLNVRPFVVPDRYPIRLVAEARGEVPAEPRLAEHHPS